MYSTGGDFRGALYIERLDQLPDFNINRDLGRLLLIKKKRGYIGTDTGWAPCNLDEHIITAKHLQFGFGTDEINASIIPAIFNHKQSNVQKALDCLKLHLSNLETKNGAFTCKKSFVEECVDDLYDRLNELRNRQINANQINVHIERPQCIKHYINKTIPTTTDLQDTIDMIILSLHYIHFRLVDVENK